MQTLIEMAGAIALLLWGIRTVRTGVERGFGARLQTLLRVMTRHRVAAAATGLGIAAALQSATAVVLTTAGFHAASTITLVAALALALGAETGSSAAAALLSLDLHLVAPACLFVGFVLFSRARQRIGKHVARILFGLAFILMALELLAQATGTMRDNPGAIAFFRLLLADPAITIIVLAVFTWLVHSSIAVVLMAAKLVALGTLPLEAGLTMVIGANLGAVFPAISSGWGLGVEARRVLLGAMIFRIGAVLIGLALLATGLADDVLAAINPAAGVTAFHLAINMANLLLFLPLLPLTARLATRLAPEPLADESAASEIQPIYLSRQDIGNPARALANTANETLRIADIAFRMLEEVRRAFDDPTIIPRLKQLDDDIDLIHRESTFYLAAIDKLDTDESLREQWFQVFTFATNLEHVGDIIESSLLGLARRKHKSQLSFSPEGELEIDTLHRELCEIFRLSQAVFLSKDPALAGELLSAKRTYRSQIFDSHHHHAARLRGSVQASLESSRIHLDILRDFQRICSHLTAVAYPILQRDD